MCGMLGARWAQRGDGSEGKGEGLPAMEGAVAQPLGVGVLE